MRNETDYTNNPLTKEQELKIDAIFAQYDTTDRPGCAVGVIQDGRFIYKKGFGMANLDYDIPITADSKFDLASMSKQFTAACVALLVLEGNLSLDDDTRKYIPELPDYGKTITIKHLLFHTSGLRDYLQLLMYSGMRFDNHYDNKDCMKIICKQKSLDFAPGDKHSYSNSGYVLLAEIISRVSGKTLRKYAEDNIFAPLGMKDTYFNDDNKIIVKNKVIPYDLSRETIHFYLHNKEDLGAGGVISTLNDLIKWNNNFYDQIVGGQKFIDLMLNKGSLNNNENIEYGFGLWHLNYKNKLSIGHSGFFFGFTTNFVRYPEQKSGIILLCNRELDVDGLVSGIADIILPDETIIVAEKPSEINSEYNGIKLSETELERFCGCYWAEESKLKRKIYLEDGNLFYWRNEDDRSKLIPIGKNSLTLEGMSDDIKLIFEFENNLKIITFLINNRCANTFISYEPTDNNSQQLDKFQGLYYSEELDVIYNLKSESGKLFFYLKDEKISELVAFKENILEIKEWGFFFEFIYNEKSELSGFKLNSERASGIIFKN